VTWGAWTAAGGSVTESMERLLRRMAEARSAAGVPPPQTVLVGASLTPSLVRRAAEAGWVRQPTLVSEFGWIEAGCDLEAIDRSTRGASGEWRAASAAPLPLDTSSPTLMTAMSSWTEQRVPAGSRHDYIVVEPREAVAVMCRLLRERFERSEADVDAGGPPPRVIIFAPSAHTAVELAAKLQGALFGTLTGDAAGGLWGLSVLLPGVSSAGLDEKEDGDGTLSVLESSLRVMEMFAANRTSVLVTTADATRGLDFPQVTDVLNLGIVGSPADYVHRAGRVGRVGQLARGVVTSVLCAAEVGELLQLGRVLRFEPVERGLPSPALPLTDEMTLEDQIAALSDVYYLRSTSDGLD